MDHTQFKANQTAAGYVADGLDEGTLEAFELHMMCCAECVEEVEVWRAIKHEMPRLQEASRSTAPARRFGAFGDWRMAASLVGAGVVGAVGGWVGRASQSEVDLTKTVVFNLPSVSRGADECTPVRLAADTRVAVLRVPGVERDMQVTALDSQNREIASNTRTQPDGSQILQLDSRKLEGRQVKLEARGADGSSEPLGCITGQTPQR